MSAGRWCWRASAAGWILGALLAGCDGGSADPEPAAGDGEGQASSHGAVSSVAAAPAPSADALFARGAAVYAEHCLSCHQINGAGVPDFQPSLHGADRLLGDPRDLIRWTLYGFPEPPPDELYPWANVMPAFHRLTDEEIAAVLTYVRRSWGNDAPAVFPVDVAGVRARENPAAGPTG